MTATPHKRPASEETTLIVAIVVLAVVLVGVPWLGWSTAALVDDTVPRPGGPGSMWSHISEAGWPAAATPWTIGYAVVLAVGVIAVAFLLGDRRRRRGPLAGKVGDLPIDPVGLRRYTTGGGPFIGHVLGHNGSQGAAVRMTLEDQALAIAGPRVGKTTALAVPAALEHPGPVIVTSNKRDIYDATATARARRGRVWLFDPQSLVDTSPPQWWWNPLDTATTVAGARRLASIWSHATRESGARTDAYFDTAGDELLAQLILAAALHPAQRVSLIYEWASVPDDHTPIDVLRQHPELAAMATGLAGNQRLPDKQRAGVYATAQRSIAWLADPAIVRWVEDPTGTRPRWRATSLAGSTDTLVSLSREGEASATPLVTSMTAAVIEAAERAAAASPSGRLPVAMLGVLDEAANVCRWRELPDLYSHLGSRGIVLFSFFQSWAQMVAAFGAEGAEKLWSSANVRIYAGGVTDTTFLRRLSDIAGEHDETYWSSSFTAPTGFTSSGGRGRTRSDAMQVRRIATLDVATLAALPAGHAFVTLSSARPVIVRLVPFFDRPSKKGRR
ncbi:MAG: type IV secretory system conjugative DNA transfer family protein [Desertimonas sp.]